MPNMTADDLRKLWKTERFKNIKRNYSAEDVIKTKRKCPC